MRALILAGVLALVCGPAAALSLPDWLGLGGQAEKPAAPPRPVVSVIVDDRGLDARWIPGVVEARTQVQLGFQTLGRMIARPVDLGDQVAAGDLLAQLSTDDLAATTRAARAAVDAADVQDRTARATLERTQALAARNVASNAQLEQAQQEASAAAAAVEQARSQLLQAEDAEGFAKMTAPFAGVVSAVYEVPGAVVDAGAPVISAMRRVLTTAGGAMSATSSQVTDLRPASAAAARLARIRVSSPRMPSIPNRSMSLPSLMNSPRQDRVG